MMPERGVLYIATQAVSFAAEAILSAWSLKQRNKGVSVTIATDLLAECPVLFERFFDKVIDVGGILPAAPNVPTWGSGLRQRVRCLQASPYRETLFIDADTRVLTRRLGRVFSRLKECNVALVEARPDMSVSCRYWGGRMFLGGVMLYDSSPATRRFLRDWDRVAEEHMRLASRKRFVRPDWMPSHLDDEQARWMLGPSQVSLVRLLSPDRGRRGLKVQILPRAWNYRTPRGATGARGVKIDSGTMLRERLIDDLARLSRWLRKQGDAGFARRYDAYIRKAVRQRLIVNRML